VIVLLWGMSGGTEDINLGPGVLADIGAETVVSGVEECFWTLSFIGAAEWPSSQPRLNLRVMSSILKPRECL
jgi:hypothetical protein